MDVWIKWLIVFNTLIYRINTDYILRAPFEFNLEFLSNDNRAIKWNSIKKVCSTAYILNSLLIGLHVPSAVAQVFGVF